MVFTSNSFLFVFLPLFLALYFITPVRHRSLAIIVGSWTFYGWWRLDFLALFIGVTVWTYLFGLAIDAAFRDGKRASVRLRAGIGIAGCLAVLGIFKYFNFFVDSVASAFGTTPDALAIHWRLILPIGISFYVFQAISYLVDVTRRDAPIARNFIDFAAFMALFPQLIAGPVLRYKDLADQIRERPQSWAIFHEGSRRFLVGFCKKVLIADTVAPLADAAFALSEPSVADAWIGALAYAIQLYFDFSGYSDMAIGLGMMMGFRFIENFNQPYISRSITEFWRRWHISLSTWLRDYLYIPLGGNRHGGVRTYANLLTTMVLGGLWHGAAWTFVVWGAIHGGVLALERLAGARAGVEKGRSPYPPFLAWPLTMLIVLIGWVFFRSAGLVEATAMLGGMAGLNGAAISPEYAWQIRSLDLLVLIVALLLVAAWPYRAALRGRLIPEKRANLTVRWSELRGALAGIGLFAGSVAAVLKLSADSQSPFLYFQF